MHASNLMGLMSLFCIFVIFGEIVKYIHKTKGVVYFIIGSSFAVALFGFCYILITAHLFWIITIVMYVYIGVVEYKRLSDF